MDQGIPAVMEPDARDVPRVADRVIALQPRLQGAEGEFRAFCRALAKMVKGAEPGTRHRALEKAREQIQGKLGGTASKAKVSLNFACSIAVDMVAQGWEIAVNGDVVSVKAPRTEGVTPEELKQRVREGHLLERDAQLREGSVREFIRTMEQQRLGPKGWVSIFSLMREGRELAIQLRAVKAEQDVARRTEPLRAAISPYLQMVEADARCEHTGFLLIDIWRYFRHTWVSTYKSLPGRSMMVLVRDAAVPWHPVIGIAALGSSMAQQSQRDQWIGWEAETFLATLMSKPSARMARWAHQAVNRLIKSIYVKDLVRHRILKRGELRAPTTHTLARLLRHSQRAAEAHVLNPDAAKHKTATSPHLGVNWEWQANTPLFRSKRTKTLARLLEIRLALRGAGLTDQSAASLKAVLASPAGRNALAQLVRQVKSEHVGVDMMDIIICGAVAPYNTLLGGKLVCLLLGSPQLVKFYRKRYGAQSSVIASSIKGRAVQRPPNLVLLATTSLYGVGSSQYNRIKVPLEEIGGKAGKRIEYLELGVSRGYGSYHFSQATIDYLEVMLGRAGDGRKVNSIFGEGVNPLMRKLREGLAELGLPSDELLRHGNARVVYGIQLAENFREVLLGLESRPRFLLPLSRVEASTERLAEFWRKRWLAGRVLREGILEAVEKHNLIHPITHGARVTLPSNGQLDLFDTKASG
jgi:Domain of unknown function (DUF4338)